MKNISVLLFLFLTYSQAYSSFCPPTLCPASWVSTTQVGDGICDPGCMSESCGYDSSSEERARSDCYADCAAKGCGLLLLGNGKCDAACALEVCGWDWGDCGFCAFDCRV